ncbi:hypothetical protein COY07_04520 [Candidatus Peregrinibacteria bacterium CG_4_10_14_0_2_um_filter_43_11]|nr:MAG: hypothetical protein COY07_04520 [Candidatus Peregrinibacteria bacterium CG_4_10_14_0_2_um_filter_43_11]
MFYIYMTTNNARRPIYTGVTHDIFERINQHKEREIEGFTKKYNCTRLVYYEETQYADIAFEREKQIKKWRREKKINLIESMNSEWKDLYEEWVAD